MRSTVSALLVASGSLLVAAAPAHAVKVTLTCGSIGGTRALCEEAAQAWARNTGNEVEIVGIPQSTTEQQALYQQTLSAGSGDIDVYMVDVVWAGLLGSHFVDLREYIDQATIDAMFPRIVESQTVDGRLVAMPWFTDAPLLFYRTDLLEKYGLDVPRTWGELTAVARAVQEGERAEGNDQFWGYVFQARAYEGLTCNGLEWINSHGGGTIVAADGSITVDNPAAAEALELAASWIGTIAPPGVLSYQEEEARGVFQSGNAAFMRNWPYAYAAGVREDSAIRGRFAVTPLPRGDGTDGRSAATLGGWQLAVSKYAEDPAAAADLVRHLTSREEQKRRAIAASFAPTYPDLYQDPEILEAVPYFEAFGDVLEGAVARPSAATGSLYNEVSAAFFNAIHATLAGQGDAATNLDQLENQLIRMSRGGRW